MKKQEILITNANQEETVTNTIKVIDEATKKIIFNLHRDCGLPHMMEERK